MSQNLLASRPARYLLDTNILGRLTELNHPMHPIALSAVTALLRRGNALFVAPQNFVELWNIATRPITRNGFGLTSAQAATEIANHRATFDFLPDTPAIFPHWEQLVQAYDVQGVQVHDTRLAAVALTYGVENILTFDLKDFRRFAPEGLRAVDPASVALAP